MTDAELRERVDRLLVERGLTIVDGLVGPKAQTGRRYREKIVGADQSELAMKIVRVIALGTETGDTVYWRVRPERNAKDPTRAYIRYLVADPHGKTRR